jgi:hypothetical protein
MPTSWLAALALAGLPPADLDRLPEDAVRRYRAVKPTPAELRWRQIPWLDDLPEAAALARKEGRPLFLWVSDDDPLDRC